MDMTPYDIDLDRNPANFQPLTPLSFLERAASIFPDRTARLLSRTTTIPSSGMTAVPSMR